MSKMEIKKKVANTVVNAAIQSSAMPNQVCFWLFGEAKSKMDLTSADYMELANHFKK